MKINTPFRRVDFPDTESWWRKEMERRYERMRAIRDMPEDHRDFFLSADRRLCAQDFEYWCSQYAWVVDPHAPKSFMREVPFHPWRRQVELSEWLDDRVENAEDALVNKSRKNGVSWTCLLKGFQNWLFQPFFGFKVGSRKEKLVDDSTLDSLFGKLRFVLNRQPPHLRPQIHDVKLTLKNLDNESEIVGESTNKGFARGGRKTVAMIDEFAHIDPAQQAAIWLSKETVALSLWIPSTPNGPGNKFAYLFEHLPKRCVFEMYWDADPMRPPNFKELTVFPNGSLTEEEFAQEYEGSFTSVTTGKVWVTRQDEITYTASEITKRIENFYLLPFVGAWDFGSGPSLLCCLVGLVHIQGKDVTIYVDDERVWQQSDWKQAARDVHEMQQQYAGGRVHFGDPNGINKDSSMESWESNLRAGGIPLVCHDKWFATREGIEWMVKAVQDAFDEDRLFINSRCSYTLSCIQGVRRDSPPGVELDWISRAYVPIRKDRLSHGADALMYLVAGALMLSRKMTESPIDVDFSESKSRQIRNALKMGGVIP